MDRTFNYGTAEIRDLAIEDHLHPKTGKRIVDRVIIDGEATVPTDRFWRSFFRRFGLADSVFRYFDPAEVFHRVAERSKQARFRYTLERSGNEPPRLLGIARTSTPIVEYGDCRHLLAKYEGHNFVWQGGVLRTTHVPRSGHRALQVGPDEMRARYVLDTPIDGFGQPKIHLALLRLICENGAVAQSPVFRSELVVGKDPMRAMTRALDSYDNDEGYRLLRQRFENAQQSWASVHETQRLARQMGKLASAGEFLVPDVLPRLTRVTGDLNATYGLANLDALSVKRQRLLPARCRVYDLINFASEMATHHARSRGALMLQSFIGTVLSDEYDLEGTANQTSEFTDLFLDSTGVEPKPSRN